MQKSILYVLLGLVLFGIPFMAYTSEEYVGAQKCKVCHIKIYKEWRETGHGKAFEDLNPGVKAEQKKESGLDPNKDYTSDASCIQCHTTGNSTMFPGVQCGACHAPGKNYTSATIMNKKKYKANPEQQRALALKAGLIIAPEEKVCLECHNEKSPTYKPFDFKARYAEVTHIQD